jgi:hypothetical protein
MLTLYSTDLCDQLLSDIQQKWLLSKIVRELRNFKKINFKENYKRNFARDGVSAAAGIRIQINIPLYFTTLIFHIKMAQLFAS